MARITKLQVAKSIQAIDSSVDAEKLAQDSTMAMLQQMLEDLQNPSPTERWIGDSRILYDAAIQFEQLQLEDGKVSLGSPMYQEETNYILTYQMEFYDGNTATCRFKKIQGQDWKPDFFSGRVKWISRKIKQGQMTVPEAFKWLHNRSADGQVSIVEPRS